MVKVKEINIIDDYKEFIDNLLTDAIVKWASDIHIEPHKDAIWIRYRIDGDLFPVYKLWLDNKDNLTARIKILSKLKIDEKRLPQDGQIVFKFDNWKEVEDVDLRVSTFPTLYWEKVVIRVLRKDMSLLNLNNLGFLNVNLNLIKKALNSKEGLILVSWPTWSWKTTTLYAMLNWFDRFKYNISTLEDPIEYKLEGINQSQVNPDIWYTFAAWLRTLLRQDPDIILVWEIRDKETAKLAIEASLTWHLVLGTIHANRWAWVIERLVNMGIDRYLIASSLKMVLSQRLVKKICGNCAVNIDITEDEEKIFQKYLGPLWESLKEKVNFRKWKWCKMCLNTGYKWRLWLHEVVLIDSDFAELISKEFSLRQWEDLMEMKGYLTLFKDWLIKVIFGQTTLEQVLVYKD